MSIKKRQAILKCFISRIALGLRCSEDKREYRDCRSFSVFDTLTGSRAEKSLEESQNMVSPSEPSVIQTLEIEIYKAFEDRLTFLN